ncbi:uncharacterized protein A4U43_C01F28250 [Asparagus officinalis]|uniref:Uncharacterized protein n=1 Tax=Asparagus officinalis TaxID=4686 RepID=A0A5P1FUM1_ASPOF|nr:uncharacterized protein A4U43_C01F28250 [Asparagus officinalis]
MACTESQKVVVWWRSRGGAAPPLRWAMAQLHLAAGTPSRLLTSTRARDPEQAEEPPAQRAKVEILVKEGEVAATVVGLVSKIGASTLVVGLHAQSFLYKRSSSILSTHSFNCRILAVKQHSATHDRFINAELSQVQITTFCKGENSVVITI